VPWGIVYRKKSKPITEESLVLSDLAHQDATGNWPRLADNKSRLSGCAPCRTSAMNKGYFTSSLLLVHSPEQPHERTRSGELTKLLVIAALGYILHSIEK
jgi:hypothetical protein